MNRYDVKKAHRELYSPPSKEFVVVDVPEFRYIAVDGRGDPNTAPAYANAIEALYGVAYTLKFASKKTSTETSLSARWRRCGERTTPLCSSPGARRNGTGRR